MYRDSNLGLLIKLSPKKAAEKISQAFVEFNAHDQQTEGRAIELVAQRLDCSPSSLKRHLRQLESLGIAVKRVSKVVRAAPPAPAKKTAKKAPRKRKAAA